MHAKSDSEVTSLDASSPPRSPRRPLYYVQSPSNHDAEKMSYGSSPVGSPHHYRCTPIHHSRESSSTTRFSASLKNPRNPPAWRKIHRELDEDDEEDDDDDDKDARLRFYIVCFVFSFVVLFTFFALLLWAASKPYKPKITIQKIVFESFNVQAGEDHSGVPTDLLTLNSTIRILYRNPATFFGVHVSATPLELYYFDLKIASGHMKEFYQSRKSERKIVATIQGKQVPLYGGISAISGGGNTGDGDMEDRNKHVTVPLNLTFTIRSRAYVLGRLVKPKFYRKIRCDVTYRGTNMGNEQDLKESCSYS